MFVLCLLDLADVLCFLLWQDIVPEENLHQSLESLKLQEGYEAYGIMSNSRRRAGGLQKYGLEASRPEAPPGESEEIQEEEDGMADLYQRAHRAAMERAVELDTERRLHLSPAGKSEVNIDEGVLEGFGSDQSRLSMRDIVEADKQAMLRAHLVFMRGLVQIQ